MAAANTAPAQKRTAKPAANTPPKRTRGPAPPSDYDDEITQEQLEALNRIVSDDEFVDFKTISGPAW